MQNRGQGRCAEHAGAHTCPAHAASLAGTATQRGGAQRGGTRRRRVTRPHPLLAPPPPRLRPSSP
eukprot:15175782-Alexandrium_andersonii.AAC.1